MVTDLYKIWISKFASQAIGKELFEGTAIPLVMRTGKYCRS